MSNDEFPDRNEEVPKPRFYFYRTWRWNWDDTLEKLFKKIFKKKRR